MLDSLTLAVTAATTAAEQGEIFATGTFSEHVSFVWETYRDKRYRVTYVVIERRPLVAIAEDVTR